MESDFYVVAVVFLLWDGFSLHSPGCVKTHFVEQVGLKLTDIHWFLPPQGLRLITCTTTSGSVEGLKDKFNYEVDTNLKVKII